MGLTRRLEVVILVPLALAVVACFAVALLLPERLSRQAQEARLVFRLEALRASTEATLALGLPVTELAATQELIERAERADPDLLAIDVFAADDGVTLYSTDLGVIGEPVPGAWSAAATGARDPSGRWTLLAEGEILVGLPVRDDLGEIVAEIVSVTAAATLGEPLAALRRTLTGLALWIVPLMLGLGAITASVLARRLAAPGRAAAAALRDGSPTDPRLRAAQRCLRRRHSRRSSARAPSSRPSNMPPERTAWRWLPLQAALLAALLAGLVAAATTVVALRMEAPLERQRAAGQRAVLDLLSEEIGRALSLGIPLDALPDLQSHLETTLRQLPDLSAATIDMPDGFRVVAGEPQPADIPGATALGDGTLTLYRVPDGSLARALWTAAGAAVPRRRPRGGRARLASRLAPGAPGRGRAGGEPGRDRRRRLRDPDRRPRRPAHWTRSRSSSSKGAPGSRSGGDCSTSRRPASAPSTSTAPSAARSTPCSRPSMRGAAFPIRRADARCSDTGSSSFSRWEPGSSPWRCSGPRRSATAWSRHR